MRALTDQSILLSGKMRLFDRCNANDYNTFWRSKEGGIQRKTNWHIYKTNVKMNLLRI